VNAKYEWKDVPWREIEGQVFKLQKRIYQASRRGDQKAVHYLQRLLVHSWAARCLAVRRVTQDNRGKRTAGVDGKASLSPPKRLQLAAGLRLPRRALPTRRVWIPKPGSTEKRPLGIPTIQDRAAQTLARLALEPEWEARFEPNSYGFRPGRSCHDAIAAVYSSINRKAKFVLDADIAKCFDRIDHPALLNKLGTFPTFRRAIKAWLAAGVMDGPDLFPTTAGTPQGGAISPLLANIALHGLETTIHSAFPRRRTTPTGRKDWRPTLVRYADDFVVLHRDRGVIERTREIVEDWLHDMGLELKPSKTRITHTFLPQEGTVGFDFLGFQVRQYRVGKTHTGIGADGVPLGFKTLIKPSHDALKRHSEAIAQVVRAHRTAPQAALIAQLNPVIKGWANYYSPVVAKAAYAKADHETFIKLLNWAKRRHPKKSTGWVVRRYWRTTPSSRWSFATKEGIRLTKHSWTPIVRHVKVQGQRSFYDGDWVYWSTRLGRHPEVPKRVATLLRWQSGKCADCGRFFSPLDLPEVDHIIPTAQGGKSRYLNWQLLHRHCHDAKTARDRARAVPGGTRDKGQ
jgi:RNA-directed DNA polymerase